MSSFKLKNELNDSNSINSKLNNQIISLKNRNEKLETKVMQLTNIAMLQKEDYESVKLAMLIHRENIIDFQRKIKDYQTKIDNLTMSLGESSNISY